MKFILIFVLFNLFVAHSFILDFRKSAVQSGFEQIMPTLVELSSTVTILNFAEDKGVFDLVLLKSLKYKNVQCSIINKHSCAVKGTGDLYQSHISEIEKSTILIFDSMKKLENFKSKAHPADVYLKTLKIYVYCYNATVNDILSLRKHNIERISVTNSTKNRQK
jgi:hypothetical protein